ncbi:MAG: NUDIX hydrolase [Mycobacteriaceae bacterium]
MTVSDKAKTPPWLAQLTRDAEQVGADVRRRGGSVWKLIAEKGFANPRPAAVLVLFSGSFEADPDWPGGVPEDAELLLTQRASTLRHHGGQIAFPGGVTDPDDDGPIGTALREAQEETAVDPAIISPLATMGKFLIPPSGFDVTPVLAYTQNPGAVRVVDPGETQRVVRVPLRQLLDPQNRLMVRKSVFYKGPAFAVDSMLVWGFTGGILASLISISGWERQWNQDNIHDLDDALARFHVSGRSTADAASDIGVGEGDKFDADSAVIDL